MRIIAIGGGKGGVGKTVLSANLAIAMAQAGARVIAIDADLGCANLHTLLGIERAQRTILSFLDREVSSLNDAVTRTAIANLGVIVGAGAVVGVANLAWATKQRLIRHIYALDADVVLIDVGAGTSYNVLDLFDVAHIRLMAVCPNLPSVQNAFSFLKGALVREIRRIGAEQRIDCDLEGGRETEKLSQSIARVAREHPALAAKIAAAQQGFCAMLVCNQVTRSEDVDMLFGVARMAYDFLGVKARVLGSLHQRAPIADSIVSRRPFLLDARPGDADASSLRRMARALLDEPLASVEPLRTSNVIHLRSAIDGDAAAASAPEVGQATAGFSRSTPRFTVAWDATLETDTVIEGRVVDASATGARIHCRAHRAISTHGILFLRVAPLADPVRVAVRWVSTDGAELILGLELVGCAFPHDVLVAEAGRTASSPA